MREYVDPRVQVLWQQVTGSRAPFGRLRLAFQEQHCQAINPYGSESCPYREEECALAFLSAVQNSLLPWIDDPAAYFVGLAHSNGIERADSKPLAREMHREGPSDPSRLSGSDDPGSDRDGAGRSPDSEEASLRRAHRRPESVGTLLGAFYARPYQVRATDGSEGNK